MVSCHFAPEMLFDIFPVQELLCHFSNVANRFISLDIRHPCYNFLHFLEYYNKVGIDGEQMQSFKRQEFLCLLQSVYSKEELAAFLRPVLNEQSGFRSFVVVNWNNARNVEELAAMTNLSTSGFTKKFRRCFRESPYRWMVRQKVECVRAEMNGGDVHLKELADKYHFASYAHFGTFCRKHYGASPRKLLNGEKEEQSR